MVYLIGMMSELQLIEEGVRLGRSVLWRLQREAYVGLGPRCWSEAGVPFQITCNAYIARQYATIMAAFLEANRGRKVYVLEVGAGSGKLGFLLLQELLPILRERGLSEGCFCLVLSDIAPKNVDFWKGHPCFRPFFERGVLDVAVYDPVQGGPLFLEMGKGELELDDAPLFVFGNYFFDTITQDLFRVEGGQLFEGRVSLRGSGEINSLQEEYAFSLIEDVAGYYPNRPAWNGLIEGYREGIERATFLFPTGAFEALENLKGLTSGPLFFLAGDKGVSSFDQLSSWERPALNLHGTFSFPVNFQAISALVKAGGGEALAPRDPKLSFAIHLYSLGREGEGFSRVRKVYHEQVDGLGTLDSLEKITTFDREHPDPTFGEMLDYLEASHWDAAQFFYFLDAMEEKRGEATEGEKERFEKGLGHVERHFFPLTQEEGVLCFKLAELQRREAFALPEGFGNLPKLELQEDGVALEQFVQEAHVRGRVLLMGANERVSRAIQRMGVGDVVSISGLDLKECEGMGRFDQALFISPFYELRGGRGVRRKDPRSADLEKKFSFLKELVYSDRDIDAFFDMVDRKTLTEPKHLLHFFFELCRKGGISEGQLEGVLNRIAEEGLATQELIEQYKGEGTEDLAEREHRLFFKHLKACISNHLVPGGAFSAFLYDPTSKFNDGRFLDEVIVSPYVDYKEEGRTLRNGRPVLWITVVAHGC